MNGSNMMLEDVLVLLSEYGRPRLNQFASSATPGLRAAGRWRVEVHIPSRSDIDWRKLGVPTTGWGFRGTADTPLDAAKQCLDELLAFRDTPDAQYAIFVSGDDLRTKENGKGRPKTSVCEGENDAS